MEAVKMVNTVLPDVIELRDIKQVYTSGKEKNIVLDNVNLLIEDIPDRGQFISLLGPSGCRKSTLLRYIAGLQKPTDGKILIYGKEAVGQHVGMVFQQYSSFPWLTVLENVALSLELQGVSKKERIEKAMEFIKICDLEKHKDKFAQYPILSGGQLQRVAIARSLVSNPNLLLMDEPFGALDINTRLKMQDMVLNIWQRMSALNGMTTIIFVTHDIAEAVYLSTDIYIMQANPGKIVNYIPVILNDEKTREIKRTKRFMDYVYDIEDKMMELTKK